MSGDDLRRGEVEVDPVTALGATLARRDGRVGTLADLAGGGPLLVAVVEHRCPAAIVASAELARAGGRIAIVSQGRIEAAQAVAAAVDLDHLEVLVEPSPHRVSESLDVRAVPTFVLVESLDVTGHLEGWEATSLGRLVRRAGGELPTEPADPVALASEPACRSRSTLEADDLDRLEADDADLERRRSQRPRQ